MIGLRNCSLNKQTIVLILKSAKRHPTLKALDIAMNTDVSSVDVLKELEDLLVVTTKIEELNLAACGISSAADIAFIANGIGKNSTLKRLHLDANKLGKNVVRIAQVANTHNKLEEITLRSTEISKKDVFEFLKTLAATDCTLKKLWLDRNDLEKAHFEELFRQLPNLEVLL